jgi:molybdenum cofactor cytidylyltransferase
MPCDQPAITPDLLLQLASAYAGGHSIVASAYANTLGTPALFARNHFPDLLSLTGDRGAKRLLSPNVFSIPFPAGRHDLDTPADYHSRRTSVPPV